MSTYGTGAHVDRIKTEARRLVSLLHQQHGISWGKVSSTIDDLVELTSVSGVNDYDQEKRDSAGSHPSEDRADQEMQRPGGPTEPRAAQSEETPAEDPEGQDLPNSHGEQLGWLDDEQWSG